MFQADKINAQSGWTLWRSEEIHAYSMYKTHKFLLVIVMAWMIMLHKKPVNFILKKARGLNQKSRVQLPLLWEATQRKRVIRSWRGSPGLKACPLGSYTRRIAVSLSPVWVTQWQSQSLPRNTAKEEEPVSAGTTVFPLLRAQFRTVFFQVTGRLQLGRVVYLASSRPA